MDEHNRPEKNNFYVAAYTLEEVADLLNGEIDDSLKDEITAARVAIRRALLKLEAELEPAEFAKTAGLIFTGANTIAHLLKTRRILTGQPADTVVSSVAHIIQELSTERGWEI